jgi:formylglycine-generating enzyme required for sulfatase activity
MLQCGLNSFYIGKYEITQKQWFDVILHLSPGNGAGNVYYDDIVGRGSTTGYTINGVDYKTDGCLWVEPVGWRR